MPAIHDRIRLSLCWVLRRLRTANAAGMRVEYKKAPDRPREVRYAARSRAGVTKPGRKPSRNEQAIFRPILAGGAAGRAL